MNGTRAPIASPVVFGVAGLPGRRQETRRAGTRRAGKAAARVASRSAAVVVLLLGLLAAGGLAGCCPPPPKVTVSVDQLVGEYNANAAAVPRLWARTEIDLKLVGDKGTLRWGTRSGLLLLSKGGDPLGAHDFVLIGKEVAEEVFRLGNSLHDGVYYYWYSAGDHQGGMYGATDLAGAPETRGLPIDPLQLLSVLCICEVPGDFRTLPAVAMSLDSSDPCRRAYVLTYIDRQTVSGRIGFRRKVHFHWDDRKPRRPFRIEFLDPAGRVAMTAKLADYRNIEQPDADDRPDEPPVMPTRIEIVFPDSGSRLRLRLSEMTTEQKFLPAVFRLWDRLPAGFDRSTLEPADAYTPEGGAAR